MRNELTLLEAFERYKARKLIDAHPITIQKYLWAIRYAGTVVDREPLVSDLSDELVSAVMAIKRREGRSPHTVNDARKVLVSLWGWLAKRRLTEAWPDVDRIKAGTPAPVAWTKTELGRLFRAASKAPGVIGRRLDSVPARLFWSALLLVLWDTGERIGAILPLPRSALVGNVLTVQAKYRKGRTRDMVYRLHPETVAALAELVPFHESKLMATDCLLESIITIYGRFLKAAGLPHDRAHKFHAIRKSVASHAAAAGVDSSGLLDHAQAGTTRTHYLDPRIVKPPQATDVLFRLS